MTYPKPQLATPFRVSRVRPDGRNYRAFKGPRAIVLEDESGEWQVLVIRCDEYQLAKDMASAELNFALAESHLVAEGPVFGWWRESIRNGDPYWVPDDVRGAPGYFFTKVEEKA